MQYLFGDYCVDYSCSLVTVLGLYIEAVYASSERLLTSALCVVLTRPARRVPPSAALGETPRGAL